MHAERTCRISLIYCAAFLIALPLFWLGCAGPEVAQDSQRLTSNEGKEQMTIDGESIKTPAKDRAAFIALPEPRLESDVSLEQSIFRRRSVREYATGPLTLEEVSQLMWAAQGITADWGGRTAPSAGALYPLETYIVVGSVTGLAPGVYRYVPTFHRLIETGNVDIRSSLAQAALGQESVKKGAIVIVMSADYQRTTTKYGPRGIRYAHLEAGHAAQNIVLQATALDLNSVTIGAFRDEVLKELLSLPDDEEPLYILPVGRKK